MFSNSLAHKTYAYNVDCYNLYRVHKPLETPLKNLQRYCYDLIFTWIK